MRILYCQKMIFPNNSAHAIHTGMTAANFAAAGAPTELFPGVPFFGGEQCMADFYRRLGFASLPAGLALNSIGARHKGLYGALFRLKLVRAMRRGPSSLCWASSVKEAAMALDMRSRWARGRGIRVVFEIHHLISRLKQGHEAERLYALERKAFAGADLVVFNCQTLRDAARGYLPEPKRALVSPLGYNERVIRPVREAGEPEPGEAEGRVRVVYVGSLQKGKGVERLIRSLAKVPDSYSLTIIGGWPQDRLETLQALAKTLGLAGRVAFAGLVEQRLLGEMLRDSDIFAIPMNTEEDFFAPIKMYEALGFGMPIMATPMPSLLSGLLDEENALFARGADPRNLAAALVRLGADPELRRQMRGRNREAAQGLSSSARARALLGSFRELFGGGKGEQ